MTDQIDPKAYAKACGCGAPAGEPCPHTPIRCEHKYWYGEVCGSTGPWEAPPRKIKEGELRTCEWCGFQQLARMTWELLRPAYPNAE